MVPLIIFGGLVVLIAVITAVQVLAHRAAQGPLKQVAGALGLEHSADRIEGTHEGRRVVARRLEADHDRSLPERYVITCPLEQRFIELDAAFWKPGVPREPRRQRKLIATDGQGKDAKPFYVGGDERAHGLLRPELRRLLHDELPATMTMFVGHNGVHLRFDRGVDVADTLRHAVALATRIADQVEAALPKVAAAPAVAGRAGGWADAAERCGLELSLTPLAISTTFRDLQSTARAVPERAVTGSRSNDYVLELEVLFRQPLALAFEVRPRQPVAAGRSTAAPARRPPSLARFDEVFHVHGAKGDADEPLDDEVRQELLTASERLGAAWLTADALRVHRPIVPRDPEPLLEALGQLAGHAELIAQKIGAPPDRDRGPYR